MYDIFDKYNFIYIQLKLKILIFSSLIIGYLHSLKLFIHEKIEHKLKY